MGKLTDEEIREFLDQPELLVRLGTVDPEGWPSVVPIWYLRQGETIYFSPRQRSSWRRHIEANPRVSMCFDTYRGSGTRVVLQAEPRLVFAPGEDAQWRDLWWQLALRYMPVARAIWYVTGSANEPRALYAVDLAEARIKSWASPPGEGKSLRDVWSSDYFVSEETAEAARDDV